MSIETPLHDTIQNMNIDRVKELLAENIDVHLMDENGQSPLHLTHSLIYEEVLPLLLEKNLSVDVLTETGYTPLYMAIYYGHVQAIKALIENGANINFINDTGRNLLFAFAKGLPRFCIDEKPVRVKIANGKAAEVTFYFNNDSYETLTLISETGDDVTDDVVVDTIQKYELLGQLLPEKNQLNYLLKLAKDFIKKGNSAAAFDNQSKTSALHIAADNNVPVSYITLLLENGADIIAADVWGFTPLHQGARSSAPELVSCLIEKGAIVNQADTIGLTPLHLAAEAGKIENIKVLIDHGADLGAKITQTDGAYTEGNTPYDIAQKFGHEHVLELLKV